MIVVKGLFEASSQRLFEVNSRTCVGHQSSSYHSVMAFLIDIIAKELSEFLLVQANVDNKDRQTLDPLPIQYVDFAASWQRAEEFNKPPPINNKLQLLARDYLTGLLKIYRLPIG